MASHTGHGIRALTFVQEQHLTAALHKFINGIVQQGHDLRLFAVFFNETRSPPLLTPSRCSSVLKVFTFFSAAGWLSRSMSHRTCMYSSDAHGNECGVVNLYLVVKFPSELR